MALILHLKYAENLKGKSDRLAKVSFRGVFHYTEVVEDAEGSAFFDQTFQWPVARPIDKDEVVEIQLFNYNRYLSNRLVGTFRMFLQELVEVGNVKICDSLLDSHNVVMRTSVTFELVYNAPDGSVGMWQKGGFDRLTSEELRSPLTEEDQNFRNLERSSVDSESIISTGSPSKSIHGSKLSLESKRSGGRSPRHTKNLSSVVKMMMTVSKQRAGGGVPDMDDKQSLIDDLETDPSLDAKAAEIASMVGGGKDSNLDDDQESEGHGSISAGIPSFKRSKDKVPRIEPASMKAQDFQVCITVIEARQLAGLNMDPVVCVQVGDQKKYTSVKESTNCPYYNEYFVFDFHMAPAMLFDKIVTLTVCQSGRLLRSNKPLGNYKLDVGTVYAATGT